VLQLPSVFSTVTCCTNLEGGSSNRDFERWIKRGSWNGVSLSEEAHCGGLLGRAPLLETLENMLSKAVLWASVSIGAQRLGNMEGRSFLRAFEIDRYIKRYIKMPCKRVSLSIGATLGNMEGIRLLGTSERKGKYIQVPFLDPGDYKILGLEAIWKFGK
jgi:hypothetical protein